MIWDDENLNVFLDVSTYCNAGCPQCHRTNPDGLGKIDWLPLVRWDLETFKKAFPPEEMEFVREFMFCGTWGDPVMCKELDLMVKYIIENSNTKIKINTNGGIRDEEWWWNLGVIGGKRLTVIFDIDGIDQQMHEKYRRFTNLEKILNNMKCVSSTLANVRSQTVVFKHNQDYKEEIKQLCKEYGSSEHSFVTSDRFEFGSIDEFIDENGNKDYLEEAEHQSFIAASETSKAPKSNNSINPNREDAHIPGTNLTTLTKEIVCRWAMPRNEIVVNPDGQVLPCCYHANVHYKSRIDKQRYDLNTNPIYDEYNSNLEKYNVFHTRLSDIMKSRWYTRTLPESIRGDNPVPQCARQCSSRIKKEHQLRIVNQI